MPRRGSTLSRTAEGSECLSTTMRPSSFSMIAVLQFTLYAGAATATCTPSATFLNSKLASPWEAPSSPQQSIVDESPFAGYYAMADARSSAGRRNDRTCKETSHASDGRTLVGPHRPDRVRGGA